MASFMKRIKSAKKWVKGTLVASLLIFAVSTWWVYSNFGVEQAISNVMLYIQGGAFLVILFAVWGVITRK